MTVSDASRRVLELSSDDHDTKLFIGEPLDFRDSAVEVTIRDGEGQTFVFPVEEDDMPGVREFIKDLLHLEDASVVRTMDEAIKNLRLVTDKIDSRDSILEIERDDSWPPINVRGTIGGVDINGVPISHRQIIELCHRIIDLSNGGE